MASKVQLLSLAAPIFSLHIDLTLMTCLLSLAAQIEEKLEFIVASKSAVYISLPRLYLQDVKGGPSHTDYGEDEAREEKKVRQRAAREVKF